MFQIHLKSCVYHLQPADSLVRADTLEAVSSVIQPTISWTRRTLHITVQQLYESWPLHQFKQELSMTAFMKAWLQDCCIRLHCTDNTQVTVSVHIIISLLELTC